MPDHVNLSHESIAWYQAIRVIDTKIAELTEARQVAVQHVQDAMADATEARIDGRPVITWRYSKPSRRLDRKALEGAFGELSAYEVENKPSRPFRILDIEAS